MVKRHRLFKIQTAFVTIDELIAKIEIHENNLTTIKKTWIQSDQAKYFMIHNFQKAWPKCEWW